MLDVGRLSNDLICSITGLKAADFDQPILEHLSPNDPTERALHVDFKPLH